MAKEQREQLIKIFARMAQAHAALMMYYDNLADDRAEYGEDEISEEDAYNAAGDLQTLEKYIVENVGYTIDEIVEQYGAHECLDGLSFSMLCPICENEA